jgi:hypothetical protein
MDYTLGRVTRMARMLGLQRTPSIVWTAHRALHWIYRRKLVLYPELSGLFQQLGLGAHATTENFQAAAGNLVHLYSLVRSRKPRFILDLGAGSSSNVIALAVHHIWQEEPTYMPTFVAIEENPKWLEHHKRTFAPDLRRYVNLIARPAEGLEIDGGRVARYTDIPDHVYDFVHVDGPDLHGQGAEIGADTLGLRYGERATILFDGREATARFTAEKLAGFRVRRHPLLLSYLMERGL